MDEQKRDELRLRGNMVKLCNQDMIELAYFTMEMLEPLIASRIPLGSFDRENCYRHCFYICKDLLREVDPEYLELHSSLKDFFREPRHLSNKYPWLSWEPEVSFQEFKGRHYASVRGFGEYDVDETVPTKKGLTLPVDLLPELVGAVRALCQEAVKAKLLGPEAFELGKAP